MKYIYKFYYFLLTEYHSIDIFYKYKTKSKTDVFDSDTKLRKRGVSIDYIQ